MHNSQPKMSASRSTNRGSSISTGRLANRAGSAERLSQQRFSSLLRPSVAGARPDFKSLLRMNLASIRQFCRLHRIVELEDQAPTFRDFVSVVNAVAALIDPGYPQIQYPADVVDLLQLLEYPYSLSTREFSCITPMVWPHLAHALAFMMNVVEVIDVDVETNNEVADEAHAIANADNDASLNLADVDAPTEAVADRQHVIEEFTNKIRDAFMDKKLSQVEITDDWYKRVEEGLFAQLGLAEIIQRNQTAGAAIELLLNAIEQRRVDHDGLLESCSGVQDAINQALERVAESERCRTELLRQEEQLAKNEPVFEAKLEHLEKLMKRQESLGADFSSSLAELQKLREQEQRCVTTLADLQASAEQLQVQLAKNKSRFLNMLTSQEAQLTKFISKSMLREMGLDLELKLDFGVDHVDELQTRVHPGLKKISDKISDSNFALQEKKVELKDKEATALFQKDRLAMDLKRLEGELEDFEARSNDKLSRLRKQEEQVTASVRRIEAELYSKREDWAEAEENLRSQLQRLDGQLEQLQTERRLFEQKNTEVEAKERQLFDSLNEAKAFYEKDLQERRLKIHQQYKEYTGAVVELTSHLQSTNESVNDVLEQLKTSNGQLEKMASASPDLMQSCRQLAVSLHRVGKAE